jgi:hypothetical protein
MYKENLNCLIIEPANDFLNLLCRPITTYLECKQEKTNLFYKWRQYFITLYNSKDEFLLMANTNIDRDNDINEIVNNSFQKNYHQMKQKMEKCSKLDVWLPLQSHFRNQHWLLDLDIDFIKNNDVNRNSFIIYELLDRCKKNELENSKLLEPCMFQLIVFMYQYIKVFDDKSININLWNYSLKSTKFSKKCFLLGLLTLVCQYLWTGTLIYNVMIDYEMNTDNIIIIIAITSTIVSLLYSYDTVNSYLDSRELYKFLIHLNKDFPEISKKEISNDKDNKKITMKIWHLKYNWVADFLSNCILPIIMPILNVLIILGSDNALDAILNSMAIFFIIQIDEDLYSYTAYEDNQASINFTRWILSVIYCKYFPDFKDIFKLETNKKTFNIYRASRKFKSNKVGVFDGNIFEQSIGMNNLSRLENRKNKEIRNLD